mmetsp:Transcript_5245/g.15934  ORF Transcript_5245/g.15934 Transcript_5245/m.15934 type:complete len:326 (+) Transcript_5245:2-979(+)
MISSDEIRARGVGTTGPLEREFGTSVSEEMGCAVTAVMFLTRVPCPVWCELHPGVLMRSMAWFPLVGTAVGAFCAWCFECALHAFGSSYLAASLSTMAGVWLCGCFHEDGLCDSLDGFGGGWTQAQILRIMTDSRVGSYGVIGASLWLSAKVAALAALGEAAPGALVVGHALGRATCAPLVRFNPYILSADDAKSDFYGAFAAAAPLLTVARLALAAATSLVVAFAVLPAAQAQLALAVLLVALPFASAYGRTLLSGVVGDFLGAVVCATELAIYLALLAHRHASARALPPLAKLLVFLALPHLVRAASVRASAAGPAATHPKSS